MQRLERFLSLLGLVALTSAPAEAQWSGDSLSQARTNASSVVVGNVVLFAGGNDGNTYTGVVDIYDTSTDTWTTASLSVPRTSMGATVVGSLALFGGGLTGSASSVVDVYDATLGAPSNPAAWSTATLSQARFKVAATTVGNRALFAGGDTIGAGVQATVDIYDATVGAPNNPAAWSIAALSLARAEVTAASAGTKAVFAGGNGFQGVPYDRVDIYDDSTGLWSTASLSVARTLGANAAAVVGTRAYFAGGHNSFQGGPNMFDVVDIYDAATGSWSTATLSVPRGYVGATAVGNTALFAGGAGQGFVYSDVVDTLNVGTGHWDATSVLSQARTSACAETVGGTAMFASGRLQGAVSAVVDIYEPVGVNYCAATVNSTGAAATISASGSASLAANDLLLSAVGVPATPFIFFHGASQIQVPFGDGYRCVGGSVVRIPPVGFASGGLAQASVDLAAAGITSPGARNFQCWFRDPAAGGTGTNTSDALEITFVP